jgi:hypothetical protein
MGDSSTGVVGVGDSSIDVRVVVVGDTRDEKGNKCC